MAIVSLEDCKERILRPVNAPAISRGMDLERQHKIHVAGNKDLIKMFLKRNHEVETDSTFQLRKRSTKAITKAVYSPIKSFMAKAWNVGGHTYQYHFKNDENDELAADFQTYLERRDWDGMNFYESIHQKLHDVHFTDFQGVFYVDIPQRQNTLFPEPYYTFIPSGLIHDIDITGHKIEFLIFKEEVIVKEQGVTKDRWTRYYCIDDNEIRVMRKDSSATPVFDSSFPANRITNTLNYVPAFVLSHETTETDNDIPRTSLLGDSMDLADLMLEDHSEHELNKKLHAFQEKWTYSKPCTADGCDQGKIFHDGVEVNCHTCGGTGVVYPTGPDKVFYKNTPDSKEDFNIDGPPAGYVEKDLEPTRYLNEELEKWEKAIHIAVFSQELQANISPETATAKEIDEDSKRDKLRQNTKFIETTVKNVVDAMAELRYGPLFEKSTVIYNRNYQMKKLADLEVAYKEKKLAGINDAILFEDLADIINAKFRNDPIKRQRELLKLHLIPFPTKTDSEVSALPVKQEDKTFRAYFNDYVIKFESEVAKLEKFGALYPFDEQVSRIREILLTYNTENVNNVQQEIEKQYEQNRQVA